MRGVGKDRTAFWDAWKMVDGLPIYLNDAAMMSTDTALTEVLSLKSNKGLDAVFFDYINLASADAESEVKRLGNITKNLKMIARIAEVPVIAAAQLNRSLESRPDKRPQMSDLRGSGEIEEYSDVIIGLYRQEYYDKLAQKETEKPNELECHILKNKDGESAGVVDIFYDARTGHMADKAKV